MTIQTYLDTLNLRYKTGISREHTYRGDLQTLLMTMLPGILVSNEPAHISCGAPDYMLTRKDIPVGYIEAKDIGVDLNSKTLKEQFERYKAGLNNLIFTDYLQFHFYKDGVFVTSIALAKIENGSIIPFPENFESFTSLIKNFVLTVSQSIKSPTRLAEMMAGKARLMADVILKSLDSDDENNVQSSLKKQMLSFKGMLIHDITNQGFADIYAQTIAYGMFAARYHDPTLPTFSREEAAMLIPKSNPFLRKLFQDIAGYDLDSRLLWIVEELISIFLASDVAKIMKNFGRSTKQEDPVVHFYETFLAAYNPALRKARGVWYTPQPVVNFIVRAVDDVLKEEFNLPQGLADISKTKIKLKIPTHDKRYTAGLREYEQEVHKVQILDPATGTGTFLAEIVRHIYKKFEGQQGIWSKYVNKDLIPRLNGFELLMASYAMAHLKMDMLLTETGYKAISDQRFRIFLTNSLEEAHPDTGTLFSSWLSDEADQANAVKRDTPVMVIIGNPPYSISTTNKSIWIEGLIKSYKKDLNERKINLDDDYIKFIRFGQHFIDRNGEGVLAYISNNSFINGITHRQMRKSLLESFDKIFILDLHGNSRIKEVSPDKSKDENVFDIMQGVSVNIFIKTKKEKSDKLAEIMHYDVFGKRDFKYEFLLKNSLTSIAWHTLKNLGPNYFFQIKDFASRTKYDAFFKVDELFKFNNTGIQTGKDSLVIDPIREQLVNRIKEVLNSENESEIRSKYDLKDTSGWSLANFKKAVFQDEKIKKCDYRPFDSQFIFYDNKGLKRDRASLNKHIIDRDNISLSLKRQSKFDFSYVFVHKNICESCLFESAYANNSEFPLYLYQDKSAQITLDGRLDRTPNLNMDIVNKIAENLGLKFMPEGSRDIYPESESFFPMDVLDYIYAFLHSPTYREEHREFLKIEFPRVPYPTDFKLFWNLVKKGSLIRKIHLMESPESENYITQYPVDGDNIILKPIYRSGNVYINELQYFANVPEAAWSFHIGGYQPAQKWLKDRKGRELSYEDILHYQKIILALTRTSEIMKEIDEVIDDII